MVPTPRALSRAVGLLCAAACLLVPATAAHAAAAVPKTFFGTVVDGPMLDPGAPIESELKVMKQTGLGYVRLPIHWTVVQPYASWDAVPAERRADFTDLEGVPSDVRALDRWVRGAAKLGLRVLPSVVRAPSWAALDPADEAAPPKAPVDYARFMTGLVKRYGPTGTLWSGGGPKLPIREWQVWNEPNITLFWNGGEWPRDYVALLRATTPAVKAVDPGAKIVAAGLPNQSWDALEKIYLAGGKGLFDIAAVHPYTRRVNDVLQVVSLSRGMMNQHKDRSPIVVTEMGWTSGAGRDTNKPTWETSEAGQASKLTAVVKALTRRRAALRVQGVFWYTWLSSERGSDSFNYAGLRRQDGGKVVSKPALAAFARTVREFAGGGKAPAKKRR